MPPAQLDAVEARVLGCLIEKSLTTPELYPLTLNALVNACNQKSSREPVMNLDFNAVQAGVNSLIEKGFAARRFEPGGRAEKYGHRAEVLLASEDLQAIGAICILLLRGPQTIGELKTRTERLCQFQGVAEVESLMQRLSSLEGGPMVARQPRQPGQKEARWKELFTGPGAAMAQPETSAAPSAPPTPDRLAELEQRVAALEATVERLTDAREA